MRVSQTEIFKIIEVCDRNPITGQWGTAGVGYQAFGLKPPILLEYFVGDPLYLFSSPIQAKKAGIEFLGDVIRSGFQIMNLKAGPTYYQTVYGK